MEGKALSELGPNVFLFCSFELRVGECTIIELSIDPASHNQPTEQSLNRRPCVWRLKRTRSKKTGNAKNRNGNINTGREGPVAAVAMAPLYRLQLLSRSAHRYILREDPPEGTPPGRRTGRSQPRHRPPKFPQRTHPLAGVSSSIISSLLLPLPPPLDVLLLRLSLVPHLQTPLLPVRLLAAARQGR